MRSKPQPLLIGALPWWWLFHWDCMVYGSPLMKQEYDTMQWGEGYRRALRDLSYFAQHRGLMSPQLDTLLNDMERDAYVIAHEYDNKQQKKRLAALAEAVPPNSMLFDPDPEYTRPLLTRPR
jgi:hypothetical protein